MNKVKEWFNFKQEMYRFRKRNRQAKREFRKMLKDSYGPFDYGVLLDMMKIYFTHVRDYYAAEDNVWSGEAIDLENHNYPTRLEIATKCVELLEKYDRCDYTEDEEVLSELFDYLKEFLVFLWD